MGAGEVLFYASLTALGRTGACVRAGCSDAALAAEVESLLTAHEEARLLGRLEAIGSRGPSVVASGAADPGRGRLQPQESLGAYEIRGFLAAGAMGDVYRARDTKLGRDVALKVLPDAFASDRDRLSRFRREAQVLASLNHPNIAHVYGLEESGPSTGPGQHIGGVGDELSRARRWQSGLALGPLPVAQA